jgi:putative lipoprotein
MKRAIAGLLAALSLSPAPAAAEERDPWFGPDKALHFGVSTGLAAGGYAGSSIVFDRPWQRAVAGASFSLSLGAAKELHDLAGRGDPSWRDFTWDVAGTAVGVALALAVDLALSSGAPREPSPASPTVAVTF